MYSTVFAFKLVISFNNSLSQTISTSYTCCHYVSFSVRNGHRFVSLTWPSDHSATKSEKKLHLLLKYPVLVFRSSACSAPLTNFNIYFYWLICVALRYLNTSYNPCYFKTVLKAKHFLRCISDASSTSGCYQI